MKISRADRSLLAEWSFTIDRGLLIALLTLVAIGVVLSVAASPAVALKKGLPTYYFVERHVFFAALGTILMIVISFFSPAGVRRLAALLFIAAIAGMIAVFFSGTEINGAQRWLTFGSYSIQPSEFAKPAFIVIIAWLFGEAVSRSDMPALPFAPHSVGGFCWYSRHSARRRPNSADLRDGGFALFVGGLAQQSVPPSWFLPAAAACGWRINSFRTCTRGSISILARRRSKARRPDAQYSRSPRAAYSAADPVKERSSRCFPMPILTTSSP